jgi:hypothetical protein
MWVTRISRQPGWVTKTALALALLVVVVPIVMLTLAAVTVGVVSLLLLGVVARAGAFISGLFGGSLPQHDDGRRNVRVIERP